MVAEAQVMAYHLPMFNKNLIKIIKAIDLLAAPGGTTVEALQNKLELSRRSVFRLIETMTSELGFPVTSVREEFGGHTTYFLEERFVSRLSNISLPHLSLSLQEATLLFFLLDKDTIFRGSELEDDLASLRDKLRSLLPADLLSPSTDARIDSLFAASPNALKSYVGREHIIDTVLDGLEQRFECSVIYHSAHGSNKTYTIQPLKLVEHRGGLYLFIRIPKHDSIRIIAIDRIEAIELTDKRFEYPKDFDAVALLESAFDLTFDDPITARIRFSAKDAPYVHERHLGPDSSIEDHSDGSCTLTITISGQDDLFRWILSFGSGAEILDPPEFRERAKAEFQKILALYKDIK
jgi:predicted DNA-binding transcriptional regulator YafY